jgi:ferredoxin--NADP+ reductase
MAPSENIDTLRRELYNATLSEVVEVHETLRILRIRPDQWPLKFLGGQYTVLGLAEREPCVAGEAAFGDGESSRMLKRAYSFSSSILDASGELIRPGENGPAEFYITLVPGTAGHPPGLTPRLFALQARDRLFLGPHPKGHYTLAPVKEGETVIFAATGTGEAPHNAMLAELLSRGHTGKIISLVCVRRRRDLGYLDVHRRLAQRFTNYRYVPLTTREPENIDPHVPGYIGKQYLQDYFESEAIDELVGGQLDPHQTHAYLCGNPLMLGLPQRTAAGIVYPVPKGMAEVLAGRGFALDEPGRPGKVHFEKYW